MSRRRAAQAGSQRFESILASAGPGSVAIHPGESVTCRLTIAVHDLRLRFSTLPKQPEFCYGMPVVLHNRGHDHGLGGAEVLSWQRP